MDTNALILTIAFFLWVGWLDRKGERFAKWCHETGRGAVHVLVGMVIFVVISLAAACVTYKIASLAVVALGWSAK